MMKALRPQLFLNQTFLYTYPRTQLTHQTHLKRCQLQLTHGRHWCKLHPAHLPMTLTYSWQHTYRCLPTHATYPLLPITSSLLLTQLHSLPSPHSLTSFNLGVSSPSNHLPSPYFITFHPSSWITAHHSLSSVHSTPHFTPWHFFLSPYIHVLTARMVSSQATHVLPWWLCLGNELSPHAFTATTAPQVLFISIPVPQSSPKHYWSYNVPSIGESCHSH